MTKAVLKGVAKNLTIIIVAAAIVAILFIGLVLTKDSTFTVNGSSLRSFLGIETRAQQEDRLKVFATGLPSINGQKPVYHAGLDGKCSELTDSSALAALRATQSLGSTTFASASTDFISQTKSQGIEWYGNQRSSKPFMKDGKTYKLMILYYRHDNKIGVEVTACN